LPGDQVMFELQHLIFIALLIAFGAYSQGFLGLGFGIILLGGVSFTSLDLERISVIGNLLLLFINGSIIFADRKEWGINWGITVIVIAGELIGVPLGYWVILVFGQTDLFRLLLGLILTGFAANEFLQPRIRRRFHQAFGFLAGVFGGFCTGGFFAGGPVYALYLYSQVDDPRQAKGTLQLVFITATLWRLLAIVFFGKGITSEVVATAGLALPLVIAFTILGHVMSRRVSTLAFRRVIYGFLGLVGIMNVLGFKV
jgi:uncharacterized protein